MLIPHLPCRSNRCLRREYRRGPQILTGVGDAVAADPYQPRGGVPAPEIERVSIAEAALERLGGHVLRIRARADPIRGVAVDALDQRPEIAEGITCHDRPPRCRRSPCGT